MSNILQVPNAILGIDVSHWQGAIDWVQVAEAGVKFAFLKATEGLVVDPMLKLNAQGAKAAGIPYSLYHVWRPDVDALAQETAFDNAVDADQLAPQLPIVLDIEPGSIRDEADPLHWLNYTLLPPPGNPIVYASPSVAQSLTDPAWLQYRLWVAHYTDAPQPNIGKWPTWMFWQRQNDGTVPGISRPVDIDWFNGPTEDFQKMVSLPT